MHKHHDLNKKVRVRFKGESGVDLGGLTKEWFLLLTRKIFQPEYGENSCSNFLQKLLTDLLVRIVCLP